MRESRSTWPAPWTIPARTTASSVSSTPCTTWAIRSPRPCTLPASLRPDGTVLLVEPFANDRVEDNISSVARLYYAASTTLCCAHAISEGGRLVLGAQAGEARLAEVFRKAGFTRFRRAAETPFNLILEARR